MATKKITINTNTDFHEYVDFFDAGAALDVSGWSFKIKLLDRYGVELLSISGAADAAIINRVWFNELQANLTALPDSGVTWFLLSLDPDNYVKLVKSGQADIAGGPTWG